MRFSEVRHQERALSIIRRALRSGRTHHAYLFEGPEGVGKELAAVALAARFLCAEETLAADDDACGACTDCRLLANGNHPDFHLIHRGLHKVHPERTVRSGKGLFLVVDLIRHFLIEPSAMKPAQGRRRVFLVRDAERMNEGAQNALLKTLEEPPGSACLILVTSSSMRLLPTIRSRCQRIPFDLLPPAFVESELSAGGGLSEDAVRALSRLADGRLGVALRWQDIGLLDSLDGLGACLDGLPSGDPESFGKTLLEIGGELAGRAQESGEASSGNSGKSGAKTIPTDELRAALKLALMLLAALYRDGLVVKAGADGLHALPQQRRRVEGLAAACSMDDLDACLRAIHDAERMLDRNVAPQLVGERLAVTLLGEERALRA